MQYLLIRHEKLIGSFTFEVSGLQPRAVVISRLFPFCINEHDCSHLKMLPKRERSDCNSRSVEQSFCFFYAKGAAISIFTCTFM